jgi:TRAP-type C4-dicarboxylate transport system permease small subunit
LNDSLIWGWDVPRLCFIWVVLLSIPLGIRYNAHVGIDLVFNLFPDRTQRFVRIVNALFMLLLAVVAGYWGAVLAFDTWDQMMPGLQLSVGLFYVALFVGQFHTCLHVLRIILTGETSSEFLSET